MNKDDGLGGGFSGAPLRAADETAVTGLEGELQESRDEVTALCEDQQRVLQGGDDAAVEEPSVSAATPEAAQLKPAQSAALAALDNRRLRGAYPAHRILFPTWITDNFDWRWVFFINLPVG